MKTTPKKTTTSTVIKAPSKKSAPAKKKPVVLSAPTTTYISAKIDIGFGNRLYVRGEGPGLSWDKGLPMDWAKGDLWTCSLKGATAPLIFKVLVNDLTWNTGKDYVVEPGQSVTVTPTF